MIMWRSGNGTVAVAVAVTRSKTLEGADIIWIPKDGKARGLRSTAELINELRKAKTSQGDIEKAIQFVDNRLNELLRNTEEESA